MTRVTTAFAAALVLFLPIGRPLLVGLTPAVGIGAGLLTTQAAFAQTANDWFDSGLAKAKRGDYQGAIDDYTRAIQINPNDAKAYSNRGIVLEIVGDLKGACTDWRKAAELGNTNAAKWVRSQY